MDELISRKEAVKAALTLYHQLREEQLRCLDIGYNMMHGGAAETAQVIVRRLMELPAVDAEVVVRCSDCVFSSRVPQQPRWLFCTIYRLPVPPEFYCGQGHVRGGDGLAAE